MRTTVSRRENPGPPVGARVRLANLLEPGELGLEHLRGDLGPPRAGDPPRMVPLGHPAVAARAELILDADRRPDRPQPLGGGQRALAERAEHGALRSGQVGREEPHARLAVGERPVPVTGEHPVVAQQAMQRVARANV